MERRNLLRNGAVGIATTVALAGCSNSEGQDTPSNDDSTDGPNSGDENGAESQDSTENNDTDEGTERGDDGTGGDDEEDLPTVQLNRTPYEFTVGESYTFDTETQGGTSVDTWEVIDTSGSGVTIEATKQQDGETTTVTKSNISEDIYRDIDLELGGGFLYTNLRNVQPYVDLEELAPGNEFTLDTSDYSATAWDSETVEVQGETTVNSVSCTEFTATTEYDGSSVTKTACVAEGYPFALSLNFEQDGFTLIAATVTDENRS